MTSCRVRMVHSLYKEGGEGSPSNPVKFNGQDFYQLRESLLKEGRLFEDDTFPPTLDSLGKLEDFQRFSEVKWLRPRDLNRQASFIVDGTSRFDFGQGKVGNCWFLSAIGALTFCDSMMAHVVPRDQSFGDNYAGIFHFRFWRFGKWVDVVIDDFLPTLDKEPVSVYSKTEKEFWAPLLEKAYAKICGSYGDMIAGHSSEAFKDFCGGVNMDYNLSKRPPDLWNVIGRAIQFRTLMGCLAHEGDKGNEIEAKFGLVGSHIFGVTGFDEVESEGENVKLVRIWNPWGHTEWNGHWSDKSEKWKTVSKEVREKCLKKHDDGEFWMTLDDFCTHFSFLSICCDTPDFVGDDDPCMWNCSLKEGRWEAGKSAGGADYNSEEFWTNPQYRLTVKAVEGDEEGDKNIILSLQQKPDQKYRNQVKYPFIGLIIYQVPSTAPKGRLSSSLFKDDAPAQMSDFCDTGELVKCYSLDPGEYLIIPCTFDPDKTSSFIITVFSKAEADLE